MFSKPNILVALLPLAFPLLAHADNLSLGTAANFAVLAASTVTNTGPTVINNGNVGVSPGTAITGFPPGIITPPYTQHAADAVAAQAQSDLVTAYIALASLAPTQTLTGQNLGGKTLTPGTYFFADSAQLTGNLTLNNQGNPTAQFVFQIGSTLTTATDSSVLSINGGPDPDPNIFWQVGSSATLGTNSAFEGNILALTSITLNTDASLLDGRALARNGAVTLDSNAITAPLISTPEPTSLLLLTPTLLLLRRRHSQFHTS